MDKRIGVVAACLFAGIATAASAQNALQKANNGLQAINDALSALAHPGATSVTQSGPVIGQPTQVQLQSLAKQLASPVVPEQVRPMWQEAQPNVQKALVFLSCYPNYDPWRYLGTLVDPSASGHGFGGAMTAMQYHAKSQCVTVTRISSWKKLANNAFSFKVLFAADDSGESNLLYFEMVKQPDGEWLFRRGGFE